MVHLEYSAAKWKAIAAGLLMTFVQASPLAAQNASRVSGDSADNTAANVLRAVRGHLDAERYDVALDLASAYLRTPRIPRKERLELLQAAAVGAYPSATASNARPDSARALLRAIVSAEPEASLFEEYRWSGLDSLLSEVRRSTFGAAVRWQSRYELVGDFAPAVIPVVATRPVRAKLFIQRQGVGQPMLVDSASGSAQLSLKLLAHRGTMPIISEGSWFLQVLVVDPASNDSILSPRVEAVADGTAPTLMPEDLALDTTQFLPEWQPPARVTGIGMGILMAASAVAIASGIRSPNMRTRSSVDGRAVGIGVAGGIGAMLSGIFDRGRPIPANVARNRALRDEYEYRTRFIRAFNRTNVANFRVKLTLAAEGR
jgi:hypothetical protein